MRKFLATLICCVVLLTSSIAMAMLESGKVIVGGVFPGMTVNQLTENFGQPTYRDGDDWIYPNFKVDIERGIVEKVSTTSNNMPTPEGVRVGSSVNDVNFSYGNPDRIDYDDGKAEHEYFSSDGTKKMEFTIANGVVTKITCELRDND